MLAVYVRFRVFSVLFVFGVVGCGGLDTRLGYRLGIACDAVLVCFWVGCILCLGLVLLNSVGHVH